MDEEETIRTYSMVKAYEEFEAAIGILHDDVEFCARELNKNDLPVWRRALVRALFAMVEGVIYRMQQIALNASHQPRVAFSPGELHLLLEKSFELDGNGNVVERQIRTSLKGSIRFAFGAFARVHVAEYELDVTREDEWGAFLKSIKVRDRLMHPKTVDDLTDSNEEIKSIQITFDWFMKTLKNVHEISLDGLEEDVRKHPREASPPEVI